MIASKPRIAAVLAVLFYATACGTDSGNGTATTSETTTASSTTVSTTASPASMEDAHLAVPGGNIWYRVVGTGTGVPVILLHGGPGFSSYYLKAFEELGNDRKVVRYDQLGGGKSDRITDSTMMTIAHFVAELDSLRAHLGYDKVDLLGHSWGTILALEYYRAHPDHVNSIVFASAALDLPAWADNARKLIRTLPDSMQRAIATAEKSNKFDAPAYQAALNEYYSRYVFRHPVQADLDSLMNSANDRIYTYMEGPSEFTITGTLKNYNEVAFLRSIKVPVLFTVGEFDEANPEIIRKQAATRPGTQVVVIKGAAHVTSWDGKDQNVQVVRDFLNKADSIKH